MGPRTFNPERRSAGKTTARKYFNEVCLLMILLVMGCHKEAPDPVQQPAATPPAVEAAPAQSSETPLPPPPLPSANVIARSDNNLRDNVVGEADPFLTGQLQLFVQQNGRLPQTFAEFSGARLDNVPRPPPGTKWVIDRAAMQVKAVAAN